MDHTQNYTWYRSNINTADENRK